MTALASGMIIFSIIAVNCHLTNVLRKSELRVMVAFKASSLSLRFYSYTIISLDLDLVLFILLAAFSVS